MHFCIYLFTAGVSKCRCRCRSYSSMEGHFLLRGGDSDLQLMKRYLRATKRAGAFLSQQCVL